MNFQTYSLGHCQRGDVVEVTLSGSAANVRLLDSSNLQNFKSRRQHRYYGGLVKRSPTRLAIPHAGTWYVTVDLQGLRGKARSSVRVIPKAALSPLPDYSPQSLHGLVRPVGLESSDDPRATAPIPEDHYDVFISHAAEDKDAIVRRLANSLVSLEVRVWYDEFTLRIGDSIRRKIDAGLARSRFGVVVISPAFLKKNWPQYELDGLVTREMNGDQMILPLWHQVTKEEVISYSPSLADKVARNTSDFTVEEIAEEIADVIKASPR